uniref:BED-type domain-containing protein n=1 Tax=Spongospora subterranea TaxID=70186 RepID=A0A0H5QI60_9EUKA|eukprot:CRZ01297.1 hypothetical protein [Spongospora subterranea]
MEDLESSVYTNVVEFEDLSQEPLLTTAGSRKRHKVSYVWAHVRQYDADRDRNSNACKSQCRFCLHWFFASINASGWKRHLLNHGIKDPASQSDSSHNSSGLRLSKQTLLPSPPNPKETAFLHNSVVDYVVTSLSPHNVVECTAFKKLISTFRPGYILQSARTIDRRVLELYVITLPLIAAFLQDLPFKFSLSFDGWTNPHMKFVFVNIVNVPDV